MYNNGNSSKNVTGASIVDGTVDVADLANPLTGDVTVDGVVAVDQFAANNDVTLTSISGSSPSYGVTAQAAISTTRYSHGLGFTAGTTIGAGIGSYDGGSGGRQDMWFATRNNFNTYAERMRISHDGYLRLAGAGIQFNGDTAAANALDDYEEGTWTGNVVTGTATVANETYTKIGRSVTVTGSIYSFSDNTTDIEIIVTGLPYVVNSYSLGAIGGRGIPLSKGYTARGTSGQSQFKIMEQSNTTAYTFMKHAALIYPSSPSTKMYFSFTYESN